MHWIDYVIFLVYLLGVLGVGLYHYFRNQNTEDYYVGSRKMTATHIGFSVVATDVGGGFSIGLGGLGFTMGLAGSWLLFSGLVGAWLTAVLVIPKLKKMDESHKFFTFPDFLRHRYGKKVALVAALISAIGYFGFSSAQMLAGAKLASVTMFSNFDWGLSPLHWALLIIGGITIIYTVLGGLKAVVYTDSVQWMILLIGLLFVCVPVAYFKVGGLAGLRESLPAEYMSLTNISVSTFINWMATIIPIWFIGMTLYQRVYACHSPAEAKKAWFIAGILEYPFMAFVGVFLGMCAKTMFPDVAPETGLPMLIKNVLPIGVTGIVLAAYFSAIMSTADSCLMAASGNVVNDMVERLSFWRGSEQAGIRLSQIATLVIGSGAILLALCFQGVLDMILHAYGFMVSGLFVPTIGAFFWKRSHPVAALVAMLVGGCSTLALEFLVPVMKWEIPFGLDVSIIGISLSLICFVGLSLILPPAKRWELDDTNSETKQEPDAERSAEPA